MSKALWISALALSVLLAACGGDDDDGTATATVEPTATTAPAPEPTEPPEPTATPEPAIVDEISIQEALLDAQPGDVIEIPAGTFEFDRGLSLTVDGVTIRGAGSDDTILSFAGQVAGAEGLLVSASDFTIEDIAIVDTVGDALKVNEGENIVIRRVRTEWTGGYSVDNGAYGIYPVQVTNVLVEDSVAIGASDAGIYVGQSNNIIVRNNLAEFNVAGIEIENSFDADVYGNSVTNNTGGILVFNLPGLSQQGSTTRVFDNDVTANNTENFAAEGTAVSAIPAGSGVLVMANDNVEIFDNRISDNRSANIIVTSSFTIGLGGEDDPDFDGFPETVYIHDNELSGGGDDPDGILLALLAILAPEDGALPDIVWDGSTDIEKILADGNLPDELRICVRQPGSEVVNADAANNFAAPVIDTEAFACAHEALAEVELSIG